MRILNPEQDERVLTYGVGLTDVAKAVAASTDTKLRAGHYDVPGFLDKIQRYGPKCVAFNGKTAAGVVGEASPVAEARSWPDHLRYRWRSGVMCFRRVQVRTMTRDD